MNPEISNIQKTNNKLSFEISNINYAFANAIRRIILTQVHSLAIDTVEVELNTGSIDSNSLAHRMGLIPLRYKEKISEFNLEDECPCFNNNCENCNRILTLDVSNETGETLNIYSTDIQTTTDDIEIVHYANEIDKEMSEKYLGHSKGILITKLVKDQTIKLKCNVRKGNGIKHAKWSCVSKSVFQTENEKDFKFSVESIGSNKLEDIIKNTFKIFYKKLESVKCEIF
jgi:DNA-directed RNA polymerase II subunit RPB3